MPTADLIQIVDDALASATARSGPHLVCRPGCTQCCIGVFPIAQQDAARLRAGLDLLTQTDPARAARIRARVADSLTRLDPWFPGGRDPGDLATYGILSEDHQAASLFESGSPTSGLGSLGWEEFANDEPCPVLDPATGTCDLYSSRPILCRTFGPPMRTEEGNLATCELCYIHATTEEIAACELDPAIPALEAASNEAFNAAHHLHGDGVPNERSSSLGWETLIAYALRTPNESPIPAT
jgi:Fe-S-cluster containining protein